MDARNTRPRRTGGISGAGSLSGFRVEAPFGDRDAEILTPETLAFLKMLATDFSGPIQAALARRAARRNELAKAIRRDHSDETRRVRESDWQVAPPPEILERRTVEIAGPPNRETIIRSLNSKADVFVADFEDMTSPTWANCLGGQVDLRDAVRGRLSWYDSERHAVERLRDDPATLMVQPRGLHLVERHVSVDGRSMPAALFDFGLFFYHNAIELARRGEGPFFYLPKLESHLEARIWSRVFTRAEQIGGLRSGTIRATVLIETLPALLEIDEILWELRDHCAGVACDRRDYVVSLVKTRSDDPAALLPDRSGISTTQSWMKAYERLVVQAAHRRGVHAIGGLAPELPVPDDPEATCEAIERVRSTALREAREGLDGTRVAHPALVAVAREAFGEVCDGPNQLDVAPIGRVSMSDLLRSPKGSRSDEGLRQSVRVGLRYLASWLSGSGYASLHDLAEDTAAAELCRVQLWQWIRHGARLDDGRMVTRELVEQTIHDEMRHMLADMDAEDFDAGRYADARVLFERVCCSERLAEYLTTPAYGLLEIPS